MWQDQEKGVSGDENLLSAFLKADSNAVAYIYEEYLPSVSNYVCSNGGTQEDARDIFQEGLLALYKQSKNEKFELSASLKTYIFSICRYQWLKTLRKNKRVESLPELYDVEDLDGRIIYQLERAEQFNLIQKHLTYFNGNNRKILELYFQEFSTKEIAEKLGLSRAYVKKKKFQCKKQLMESIKNDSKYIDFFTQ